MRGIRIALRLAPLLIVVALVIGGSATGGPASVTLAGDFQHLLGCPADWAPDCTSTDLASTDGVFTGTFSLPAGSYNYKAALNHSWDESYGLHTGGENVPLAAPGGPILFAYDPVTHWVADSVNAKIVTAAGDFQSELGCAGDWLPDCMRAWLEAPTGGNVYTFSTRAIPVGTWQVKATVGRSWDENYGAGGVRGGANISFSVTAANQLVEFSFDATTHTLTVQAGHAADDNVEWDGLRFDSRSTLYKVPVGAVPAGTTTTVRFRTFHDDVTSVTLRDFSVEQSAEHLVAMKRVASGVSCYQPSLANDSCDYWQGTLAAAQPDVHWYRFIVKDGTATAYYADDTAALDGGLGTTTADVQDRSYAQTVYDPSFQAPAWAKDAVVYQIFPDRFRNGDVKNDPRTGDVLYDLGVIKKAWNALPEGYCRGYNTSCSEAPNGRDFFGGDLKGIRQSLEQIHLLGFNAIYLNPIFWSKSNHGYDTADYKQINPYLGDLKDFTQLVQQAHALGMHIILDGVFNHMSSDSPFFDRYHHSSTVGACESLSSQYRSWFTFTNDHVPCTSGDYSGWFNFDSIPVLNKSNPAVQDYFLNASDSVTRYWLNQGADGWRLDVMGDSSFPDSYWTTFRRVVKETDPNALIIGELWPKDSTTLRFLDGQRADSTMNYRDRDAIVGFLTTHGFDGKGLGDSGRELSASEFLARLASQQEDYAKPAYFALMNLIDSHDTTRALWTLSPGAENDPAAKAAGAGEGKQRLRLASLVQYTLPGMPTVYYGDEVGVTGSDDPDNRRTYPWPQDGGKPDTALQAHYGSLGTLRAGTPVLRDGSLVPLAADDAAGTVAYGRKTGTQAAIVVLDKGAAATVTLPTAGFVPDGTSFTTAYGVSNPAGGVYTTAGGALEVPLAALSGLVLVTGTIDLTPPAAPTASFGGDGDGSASISWTAVDGAASYEVFRSPVSGGGYLKVGTTASTSFADSHLTNGAPVYYVVEAVDAAGNESVDSNEVEALPHLTIGWANLQWPPSYDYTLSVYGGLTAYGQVWIDGWTNRPGATPTLEAQLGYGTPGTDRAGWTWTDAAFNTDAGNNDEFTATINPQQAGTYAYTFRYTTTGGRDWTYAVNDPGTLIVHPSGDTTPAPAPTGLHVTSFSPGSISLAWNAVSAADEYGYEVLRSPTAGGPYASLGIVTGTSYEDDAVDQGHTYSYVLRSVDTSWNRSGNSNEVSQLADLRTMTITFEVTVPASTDGTGRPVHIAGTLAGLGGSDWDPTAGTMTRVDATHWTVTLTGKEATSLQYKYVLGDWNYVEKDASCGEISNRALTMTYGASGTQTVNDTVPNWRNVAPCGN
jgi:glycosidase